MACRRSGITADRAGLGYMSCSVLAVCENGRETTSSLSPREKANNYVRARGDVGNIPILTKKRACIRSNVTSKTFPTFTQSSLHPPRALFYPVRKPRDRTFLLGVCVVLAFFWHQRLRTQTPTPIPLQAPQMLLCLDARYDGTDCTRANPNLSSSNGKYGSTPQEPRIRGNLEIHLTLWKHNPRRIDRYL